MKVRFEFQIDDLIDVNERTLAASRVVQKIRLRGLFGDGFDIDIIWFPFAVLRFEGPGTPEDHGCDFLRHTDGRFKLGPEVEKRDFV